MPGVIAHAALALPSTATGLAQGGLFGAPILQMSRLALRTEQGLLSTSPCDKRGGNVQAGS